MMKKTILGSVAIVVISVAIGFFVLHRNVGNHGPVGTVTPTQQDPATPKDKTFALVCINKKAMAVTFHLPADTSVDVALSDGRKLNLLNDKDGKNPHYLSADKTIILSNTGQNLVLTENNQITYDGCILSNQ